MRLQLLASSAAAMLTAASSAAPAQARTGSDGAQLEEIIVTPTKRAERPQEVPASVTAMTADAPDRNTARELGDLVKLSGKVMMLVTDDAERRIGFTIRAATPAATSARAST